MEAKIQPRYETTKYFHLGSDLSKLVCRNGPRERVGTSPGESLCIDYLTLIENIMLERNQIIKPKCRMSETFQRIKAMP